MSHSHEMVVLKKERAGCIASISQRFDGECGAESGSNQLATEDLSQLRTMLSEMTLSQLSILARSWGIYTNASRDTHESLYDACSEVIDTMMKPPDTVAIHRQNMIERFFGSESRVSRQIQPHYRGVMANNDNDSDCERPRARSASPRADLTVEHFECPICLENVPSRSTLTLPCCLYEACKSCVIQSMKLQMADRSQLRCLHCSSITSHYHSFMEEVTLHADPRDVLAWRTQVALNAIPDCRQCTQCQRIHAVDSASEDFPTVTCKSCGHVYCFDHGDAHVGKPCPPLNSLQIDSQIKISAISKQCPFCKVHIERSGGCPHMTCAICSCDWCWTCGKSWYQTGNHETLLDTCLNDSKNCLSAFLFFVICFFVGRNSVFFSSNLCTCNGRNKSQSVRWQCYGSFVKSDTFMRWLLIKIVLLRHKLQPAGHGQVLWTAYLGSTLGYYLLKGSLYVAKNLSNGILRILVDWSFTNMYYKYYFYEALPGPPQLTQQVAHFFMAISNVVAVGICVGILTYAAHNVIFPCILRCHAPQQLWGSIMDDPESSIALTISSLMLLVFLPGLPDHGTQILNFWVVWLACQICMTLFFEANQHCHWTPPCDNEFIAFWATFWGFAALVLKLILTMDYFDHRLIVCGCLVLAYAFTVRILLNSRYRLACSTCTLAIQLSILSFATMAALHTMMPAPFNAFGLLQ